MKRQQSPASVLSITACTAQHLGDRTEQQDRVAVLGNQHGSRCALGLLADGMGGRSGGSVAADNVMLTSRRRFSEFVPGQEAPEAFFRSLVDEVHTVLRLTGMTTGLQPHSTFAAVLMQPDRVDWCHVGDSRVYHIRDRRLMHCTSDHTYGQQLVSQGKLSRDQVHLHPSAHLLVNALGSNKTPVPTMGSLAAPRPGDTFLICSDGLWNYFHAGELVLVLEQPDLHDAARTLIARARERAQGDGDNCSLVVLRFVQPDKPVRGREHTITALRVG